MNNKLLKMIFIDLFIQNICTHYFHFFNFIIFHSFLLIKIYSSLFVPTNSFLRSLKSSAVKSLHSHFCRLYPKLSSPLFLFFAVQLGSFILLFFFTLEVIPLSHFWHNWMKKKGPNYFLMRRKWWIFFHLYIFSI